jgi:antitoxin FitA
MGQWTVRNVGADLVRALKQRAAAQGRSTEAEHREIRRQALLGEADDFAVRAVRLAGLVESADMHYVSCIEFRPNDLA